MSKKVGLKLIGRTKFIFLVALIVLLSTSLSFAAESNVAGTEALDIENFVPKIGFSINSNEVLLFDGSQGTEPKVVKNPAPVISVEGTTYIPIRGFADSMGYTVDYNVANKTILLNDVNHNQSWQFSSIQKMEDVYNEKVYFSINGNAYTKIQNLVDMTGLQMLKSDGVFLLYSNLQSDSSSGSAINNSENLNWEQVLVVDENELKMTESLKVLAKQNAVAPKENYGATVRRVYDGSYYKTFVNPYVPYSYPQLLADAEKLKKLYPEYIKTGVAGKSVEGRDLITIEFGRGPKNIYLFGSHHAREYISTAYIMTFIDKTASAVKTGVNTTGYDLQGILNQVTYHIIPMVNPDGVNLVQNGIESVSPQFIEKVRAMPIVDGKAYGTQAWKSNINGVDLNRNYPSNWDALKTSYKNASSGYPGPSGGSEPEVQAVMNYMRMYKPDTIVSVHSQGNLIYWSNPENNLGEMGRKIVKDSGYRPIMNRVQDAKGGFLSNYARDTYHTYEITIELCRYTGPYPYPNAQFDTVWNAAKNILYIVGDEIRKK